MTRSLCLCFAMATYRPILRLSLLITFCSRWGGTWAGKNHNDVHVFTSWPVICENLASVPRKFFEKIANPSQKNYQRSLEIFSKKNCSTKAPCLLITSHIIGSSELHEVLVMCYTCRWLCQSQGWPSQNHWDASEWRMFKAVVFSNNQRSRGKWYMFLLRRKSGT